VQKFFASCAKAFTSLREHREIVHARPELGIVPSAMMTGVSGHSSRSVDDVYHKGRVGYGWLNGGWGRRRIRQRVLCAAVHQKFGARRSNLAISLDS